MIKEEEQINGGNVADTTTANENETHENENEIAKDTEPKQEEKLFTQEEVNRLISERLDKQQSRLFKKYGINAREELDLIVGKSQQYDEMKSRYDELASQNELMSEKLLMLENNISPDKVDDLKYYFKGKGIPLNEENLKNELLTHQNWVKKAEVKPIGVEHKPTTKVESEDEYIKRVFKV